MDGKGGRNREIGGLRGQEGVILTCSNEKVRHKEGGNVALDLVTLDLEQISRYRADWHLARARTSTHTYTNRYGHNGNSCQRCSRALLYTCNTLFSNTDMKRHHSTSSPRAVPPSCTLFTSTFSSRPLALRPTPTHTCPCDPVPLRIPPAYLAHESPDITCTIVKIERENLPNSCALRFLPDFDARHASDAGGETRAGTHTCTSIYLTGRGGYLEWHR